MKYRTVLADPPWRYDDKLTMSDTKRGVDSIYKHTMSVPEICAFLDQPAVILTDAGRLAHYLPPHHLIADDAHLWLWVTNSFLIDGTAEEVAVAWGFVPKAMTTWVKGTEVETIGEDVLGKYRLKTFAPVGFGMGHYTRGCTEHLVLCTRGKGASLVLSHSEPNLIVEPSSEHSAKPEKTYAHVEAISPGPRLELFARRLHRGWDAVGDELKEVV